MSESDCTAVSVKRLRRRRWDPDLQRQGYPFTPTGELIGLGAVATLQAAGTVYNLDDPSQFSGAYIQGTRSLANSVSTTGDLWLKNNNGVIRHLAARNAGLILGTGRFEVFIELTR